LFIIRYFFEKNIFNLFFLLSNGSAKEFIPDDALMRVGEVVMLLLLDSIAIIETAQAA